MTNKPALHSLFLASLLGHGYGLSLQVLKEIHGNKALVSIMEGQDDNIRLMNIVERIKVDPLFSTTAEILNKYADNRIISDFIEAVSGNEFYTIFVPTNSAFRQRTHPVTETTFTTFLVRHIIPRIVLPTEEVLPGTMKFTTAGGGDISIMWNVDDLSLGVGYLDQISDKLIRAEITMPDIFASNGVIHAVDGLLIEDVSGDEEIIASSTMTSGDEFYNDDYIQRLSEDVNFSSTSEKYIEDEFNSNSTTVEKHDSNSQQKNAKSTNTRGYISTTTYTSSSYSSSTYVNTSSIRASSTSKLEAYSSTTSVHISSIIDHNSTSINIPSTLDNSIKQKTSATMHAKLSTTEGFITSGSVLSKLKTTSSVFTITKASDISIWMSSSFITSSPMGITTHTAKTSSSPRIIYKPTTTTHTNKIARDVEITNMKPLKTTESTSLLVSTTSSISSTITISPTVDVKKNNYIPASNRITTPIRSTRVMRTASEMTTVLPSPAAVTWKCAKVLENNPNLSYFNKALQASGIKFRGNDLLTIFAPINGAIQKLPPSVQSRLTEPGHAGSLAAVMVQRHTVYGKLLPGSNIPPGTTRLSNMGRGHLTITRHPQLIQVSSDMSTANIIKFDMECDNGIIHTVDSIL